MAIVWQRCGNQCSLWANFWFTFPSFCLLLLLKNLHTGLLPWRYKATPGSYWTSNRSQRKDASLFVYLEGMCKFELVHLPPPVAECHAPAFVIHSLSSITWAQETMSVKNGQLIWQYWARKWWINNSKEGETGTCLASVLINASAFSAVTSPSGSPPKACAADAETRRERK